MEGIEPKERSMKPSTKAIFRRHGLRLDRALHNWVYFVFYTPYVKAAYKAINLVERRLTGLPLVGFLAGAVFERYHSKVLSFEDAKKILLLDKDLVLGYDSAKRIIPYKYANKLVIKNPSLIAVMDCPCKKASKAPCEPVGSCIAVGEDFAPLWLEHCAHNNVRQITSNEALAIIKTMRASGHIQQAFLKVGTGGVTGVICNCCPKCCASLAATRVAKQIDPSLSMNAQSGYSVKARPDLCRQCGACQDACPFDAMRMTEHGRLYNKDSCMGCGLCVDACPNKALSLYADSRKLMPLDIDTARAALEKN
jgi:NAD-dependent dihydropyrimidine dehydrogenase PreA subunit